MKPEPVLNQLMDIQPQNPVPGGKARFIHSEHMTMAYWEIDKDAAVPEHSHPHEQISHVLEGVFELTINEKAYRLVKGSVMIIPSQAVHHGRAIEPCRVIDFFHPVREDFKK
ncbi:MAG: cupin domain-containing protein [Desulfobacteraceae bacterium]|nr:cupin domain-containing protein [Desulfobacteraceae bacterium]